MNYTYYISTAIGLVAGFDVEHQCVMYTDGARYAKRFNVEHKARLWAQRYSDKGYGLTSGKWRIKDQTEL
jgi:hypothetical protein